MRKKTFNRIITAGLTIISLFLVFTISVYAADTGVISFRPIQGSSMYDSIEFTVTQYLSTDTSEGPWQGMKLSKTFTFLDGNVRYYTPNQNYIITFYPFAEEWYVDSPVDGVPGDYYNNGGYFECTIRLPFKADDGTLFDSMKLNESAYINFLHIVTSLDLHTVNERNFTCSIRLSDGGKVLLRSDSINTISDGFFVIDSSANIPCSELDSFEYTFRYNGLSNPNNAFEFSLHTSSYINVVDYSNYGDSSLSDSKDKLTQLQNAMNQPAPDIGSALGNIKSEDMALTGSLFADSKKGVFYTFLTSLMVVGVSLGLVGYVLHGKK